MASACVNKITENNFFDFPPSCTSSSSPYGWLSPRISFSRDEESSLSSLSQSPSLSKIATGKSVQSPSKNQDLEISGIEMADFEFRLEDPVKMLPADELFSDGKLVPLQIRHFVDSTIQVPKEIEEESSTTMTESVAKSEVRSSSVSASWTSDPYLFSPKAPRCSSRWKELLGLKKQQQQNNNSNNKQDAHQKNSSKNPNPRSLKYFLHRNNNNSAKSADSLPLLKDIDVESLSLSSSRLSLSSSSSSGPDQEDLPRLSLDSDKPRGNPPPMKVKLEKKQKPRFSSCSKTSVRSASADHPITVRVGRSAVRSSSNNIPSRGVSVDSPRMNSSGKIVFQSLERSSSSPSSFNGGPNRIKSRGMERSYSANVRVTPVLNVPVCSLRGSSKSGSVFGFGQLFSSANSSTRTQIKRNRN